MITKLQDLFNGLKNIKLGYPSLKAKFPITTLTTIRNVAIEGLSKEEYELQIWQKEKPKCIQGWQLHEIDKLKVYSKKYRIIEV